jgi:DnaJ-class molecular chaperone
METHDDLVTIQLTDLEPSPRLCDTCHGYGKAEHPNGGKGVCPVCNGEGIA